MTTLTDFLLARIAEDEVVARTAQDPDVGWGCVDYNSATAAAHGYRHNPARVLAECDAKRRLIEFSDTVGAMDDQIQGEWGVGPIKPEHDQQALMLRLMALPYADHPDYLPEWRP